MSIKPKFSIDDRVAFTDSYHRTQTGQVTQVSKKTYFVMVRTEDGQLYSMHENALTLLK